MNEYDRNFVRRCQRGAGRARSSGKDHVDVAREKLADRRLQSRAVAFDVARFEKKIFPLLIAELFEPRAQAFKGLRLGALHLLH